MTMGRPPHPFDPDKLRADIEAGRTVTAIAAEEGCSDKAVRNALRRYGIVRPRRLAAAHPELEDPDWLRAEYVDKGRTAADIARECNTNAPTLRDYLARAGIATRNARPGVEPRRAAIVKGPCTMWTRSDVEAPRA